MGEESTSSRGSMGRRSLVGESEEHVEASERAEEAWDQRYKHGKAARAWDAVAIESPHRARVSQILSEWMAAYEAADAAAEKAFRTLAAEEPLHG
jgi:hypothetical protein